MGTIFKIVVFSRLQSTLLQIFIVEIILAPHHENADNALVQQRAAREFLFPFKYVLHGQNEQGDQKCVEQNCRMA